MSQFEIKRLLKSSPPLSRVEISEKLNLSRSGVKYNLARLKKRGLIKVEYRGLRLGGSRVFYSLKNNGAGVTKKK